MSAARSDPAMVVALENKQSIQALKEQLTALGKRCRQQQQAFEDAQKKQKQNVASWKERALLAEETVKHMHEKVVFTEQLQKGNKELEEKLKDTRAQLSSCQWMLEKERREKLDKYQTIQNKYHTDTQEATKRAMQRLEEAHANLCEALQKSFETMEMATEKRNAVREAIIPHLEQMRLCVME